VRKTNENHGKYISLRGAGDNSDYKRKKEGNARADKGRNCKRQQMQKGGRRLFAELTFKLLCMNAHLGGGVFFINAEVECAHKSVSLPVQVKTVVLGIFGLYKANSPIEIGAVGLVYLNGVAADSSYHKKSSCGGQGCVSKIIGTFYLGYSPQEA